MKTLACAFLICALFVLPLQAVTEETLPQLVIAENEEVPDFRSSQIRVRENRQSGKPYVSIVKEDQTNPRYAFQRDQTPYQRPDYRMLSQNKKEMKTIAYDGPESDRTKIYLFAGTLIASGIAVGTTAALAPVATAGSAAASGGAGAFGLASLGIATGSVVTALHKSKPDPDRAFIHESKARILQLTKPAGEEKS